MNRNRQQDGGLGSLAVDADWASAGPGHSSVRVVSAAVVFLLAAVSAYRAATQPITIDEAITYTSFASGDWAAALTPSSNNHYLNTILVKASVVLFGLSEFAVRLPALLAGLMALFFVRRFLLRLRHPLATLCGLGAFAFNLLIVDYFALARGYGLALAGLCWLLDAVGRSRAAQSASPTAAWRFAECGLAAAFTIAGNLTFMPAALGVILFTGWLQLQRPGGGIEWGRLTRWAVWTSVPFVLALWPFANAVSRMDRGQFYHGAPNLGWTLVSLAVRSVRHVRCEMPGDADAVTGSVSVLAGLAGGVLGFIGIIVAWRGLQAGRSLATRGERPTPARALVGAAGCGLVVSIAAGVTMALVDGFPYPRDRTGLHILALIIVGAAAAVDDLLGRGGRARVAAIVLAMVMLGAGTAGAVQLPLAGFAEWSSDVDSRRAFEFLEAQQKEFARPLAVFAPDFSWAGNLRFYRAVTHAAWLDIDSAYRPERAYDFTVVPRSIAALPGLAAATDTVWASADGGMFICRIRR